MPMDIPKSGYRLTLSSNHIKELTGADGRIVEEADLIPICQNVFLDSALFIIGLNFLVSCSNVVKCETFGFSFPIIHVFK